MIVKLGYKFALKMDYSGNSDECTHFQIIFGAGMLFTMKGLKSSTIQNLLFQKDHDKHIILLLFLSPKMNHLKYIS